MAHYDEDLTWTTPYRRVRTVYSKGPRAEKLPFIQLPNVGREQHSYLEHIVRHYDDLAEHTVFMHGREPSCGFFLASGERGGHLNAGVSVQDYLASTSDVFMPLTARTDANLSRWSLRSTFTAPLTSTQRGGPLANESERGSRLAGGGASTWPRGGGDHWLPWEANDLTAFLCELKGGDRALMTFEEYFRNVFGRKPPSILFLAQGAQFAASWGALRRTSRATYAWLKAQLEEDHVEVIFYLELTWHYLLRGFEDAVERVNGDAYEQVTPLPWLAHLGNHTNSRDIVRIALTGVLCEVFPEKEPNAGTMPGFSLRVDLLPFEQMVLRFSCIQERQQMQKLKRGTSICCA